MTPTARAALAAGKRPIVVCLLRLRGGTVYAFGTEAAQIDQRGIDTAPIQVSPGLVVDETESAVDPFGLAGETALSQAQVSILLPASLAGAQGDWRYIGAATAELARLWPGDDWQARESLLAGTRLSGLTLGVAGEPSTFTIEAARAETSAALGNAARTVGLDFPTPIDAAGNPLSTLEGVEYPSVYGQPYRSQGLKIGEVGGDNYDRVIIAGHAFAVLSNIDAYADGVSLGTFPVLNATTTGGDAYAYIRSNVPGTFDATAGAITVWPRRGGIAAVNGTAAALSFGDLLELWLLLSDLKVNWPAMRPALDRLRSWPGGVYMDAETPAIDAIRDHLLPLAPLIEMQSSGGVWFYYADLETPIVRGTLTEGQELVGRVGGVGLTEIEDIRNAVTVRYALDEFTGELVSAETVDADTDAAAYVSAQLYGTRVGEVIDAGAVGDGATARRVGRSYIQRRATQRRVTSWLLSDWAEVTIGEVYRVVAPSVGVDRAGVVTALAGVVGRVATFTILDGPL